MANMMLLFDIHLQSPLAPPPGSEYLIKNCPFVNIPGLSNPSILDISQSPPGVQVSLCWSGEKFVMMANLIFRFSGGEFRSWAKKSFKRHSGEKNVLGPSRGSGGLLSQKILKI